MNTPWCSWPHIPTLVTGPTIITSSYRVYSLGKTSSFVCFTSCQTFRHSGRQKLCEEAVNFSIAQ